MIQDLDKTLQAIFEDPLVPTALREADVSFETPDKNYTPNQATLNLFLHEMKENRELRDPEPIQIFEDGLYKRRLPPLRVACSYLVTGWSSQTGALKVAEEHRLLGQALGWLCTLDPIPQQYWRGALIGQPYPPQAMVAQLDGRKSLGEFWSALGIAPRPAFTLQVTVALVPEVEHPVGREVITHETRLGVSGSPLQSAFLIGGTVRAADSNAPLAAAITIKELERTVQTDTSGHYRFSGLASGHYTLHAAASGFVSVNTSVEVPAAAGQSYNIVLNPS